MCRVCGGWRGGVGGEWGGGKVIYRPFCLPCVLSALLSLALSPCPAFEWSVIGMKRAGDYRHANTGILCYACPPRTPVYPSTRPHQCLLLLLQLTPPSTPTTTITMQSLSFFVFVSFFFFFLSHFVCVCKCIPPSFRLPVSLHFLIPVISKTCNCTRKSLLPFLFPSEKKHNIEKGQEQGSYNYYHIFGWLESASTLR